MHQTDELSSIVGDPMESLPRKKHKTDKGLVFL